MIAVTLESVIFMYQIEQIKMNRIKDEYYYELNREQIELIKEEYYSNQLPEQL